MTMYDDSRVVTLLREIDPPLAPPDRLGAVTRRARRNESRRTTALAGVMALVLGAGVVTALNLGDGNGTEQLSVAQAAQATTAAGTARFSMRISVSGGAVSAFKNGAVLAFSGPVDFARRRYSLKGTLAGRAYEIRGIGTDVWTKSENDIPGKPWLHMSEVDQAGSGLGQADPDQLLEAMRTQGTQLSSRQEGDRTVTRLRVPSRVLGGPSAAAPIDVTAEIDSQGRIRKVSYRQPTIRWSTTVSSSGAPTSPLPQPPDGSSYVQIGYDDFGIPVDVEPPPADQVGDVADLLGKQFGEVSKSFQGLGGMDGCRLLDEQFKTFIDRATPEQRATFKKLFADARAACVAAQRSAAPSPHR